MTTVRSVQRRGGSQPPISAHPVFPVIVALWFAALFGIGSLVLPSVLLEKTVDATGLAAIMPAAAPPLGFSARLILAAVAAVTGAICGLLVARKVAASQSAPQTAPKRGRFARAEETLPAKRPIVATEELGEEGLGTADDGDEGDHSGSAATSTPLPGRRRSLSVTDDSGPSEFLFQVPVPGESTGPASHNLVTADDASPAGEAVPSPSDAMPEQAPLAEEEERERPFDAPIAFPGFSLIGEGEGEDAAGRNQIAAPSEMPGSEREETPMPAAEAATARPFPPALPERQMFGEPQPGHSGGTGAVAAANEAAHAPADTPLAELPMSDLIARFARSMQSAAPALLAAEPAMEAPDAAGKPAEDAEDAVRFAFAREAGFAAPDPEPDLQEMPAALRPLDLGAFEEEDDGDDDPFFDMGGIVFGTAERSFAPPTLSVANLEPGDPDPAPAPEAESVPAADDEDTGDSDGYSSLLSMKAPLGSHREFVRIEDDADDVSSHEPPEQAVVFPGTPGDRPALAPRLFDAPVNMRTAGGAARALPAAPAQRVADPAETERALRDALDKLQRMSGAA